MVDAGTRCLCAWCLATLPAVQTMRVDVLLLALDDLITMRLMLLLPLQHRRHDRMDENDDDGEDEADADEADDIDDEMYDES